MKKETSQYILLIDPSLKTRNIGDHIIAKCIFDIVQELFPQKEIVRIPVHEPFNSFRRDQINNAYLSIVAGTNLLSNDVKQMDRFVTAKRNFWSLILPRITDLVLLGVGWNQYDDELPKYTTRKFYERILSKKNIHSVRDSYTKRKLEKFLSRRILNTCCPTTWNLDLDFKNLYNSQYSAILFTLTDYCQSTQSDNKILELLFHSESNRIYFFPQGSEDIEYINSLATYKRNKNKVFILGSSLAALNDFVTSTNFNFIGTRLHSGIYCMQFNKPSLIVGIDNRALEIGKDTNMNVINRDSIKQIENWIFKGSDPGKINLPLEDIDTWKKQFLR